MTLKETLDYLWNWKHVFNPCHINIWSNTKRGMALHWLGDFWVSKGRKVVIR